MTNSEADCILAKTIEELLINYDKSKATGADALTNAIQLLDDRIQAQQNMVHMPLWNEICQQHRLSESEWALTIAGILRTIAARCQVWEITEWLEAEADLAEFQHE